MLGGALGLSVIAKRTFAELRLDATAQSCDSQSTCDEEDSQSSLDDSRCSCSGSEACDWTTLLLRQLPLHATGQLLRSLLDDAGFLGCYDFIYVPLDLTTNSAFGFAHVNFVTHQDAQRARMWLSKDGAVVERSAQQGLDAQVERYRNSPIMHPSVPEAFKPMVFRAGMQLRFPAPTTALSLPAPESREKKRAKYRARRAARLRAEAAGSKA